MSLARVAAGALRGAAEQLTKNNRFWAYTITDPRDGEPYLSRVLLPRVRAFGLSLRPLVHQIHRDDRDPYPHTHPWRWAYFVVVSGGYVDERWVRDDSACRPSQAHACSAECPSGWRRERRVLWPGDVNSLRPDDLHRVLEVEPGTVTVGVVGDRVQQWGFLVDDAIVPAPEYFRRTRHVDAGGAS